MSAKPPLHGHPDMREAAVPVATVWTSPEAPRDVDAAAVADLPDLARWTRALDQGRDGDGPSEHRLGLHGRTLTQLLIGEPALVLEEAGGWSKVAGLYQESSTHEHGYPGWVRTAHLATPVDRTTGPTAFVVASSAACEVEQAGTFEVSCGTGFWVDDAREVAEDRVAVLLPGGQRGTLPRSGVRLAHKEEPSSYSPDDLLATARLFLGVRYLWGGTTGWGLDCSGLVHLTYRTHGKLVPRDAFDQAASPRLDPVDLAAVQPGDLYFFARPGERVYHVGFATRAVEEDGTRWMLHAPEGGGLVEDAPMAPERVGMLVSAGRFRPSGG